MNGSFNPVFCVAKESGTYHQSIIKNKRKYVPHGNISSLC